jgi:hypothetical protein
MRKKKREQVTQCRGLLLRGTGGARGLSRDLFAKGSREGSLLHGKTRNCHVSKKAKRKAEKNSGARPRKLTEAGTIAGLTPSLPSLGH